jgi:rubredoxin
MTAHGSEGPEVSLNAHGADRIGGSEGQDERGSLVLHGAWIKICDFAFYLIEGRATVSNNETSSQPFQTWMCLICGWVYDESAGLPDEGIAPGTRWADVPMNWTCPECGARKEDFEMVPL